MPIELGYRMANEQQGGFDVVTDENPLPVYLVRMPVLARGPSINPVPFTFPLVGSVAMVIKTAQGYLCSVVVSSVNAGIRYLQIFNQTTAPVSAQVPVLSIPIGAGTATVPLILILGYDILGPEGLYLATGIALGVSTTAATYTAATASDHVVSGTFT